MASGAATTAVGAPTFAIASAAAEKSGLVVTGTAAPVRLHRGGNTPEDRTRVRQKTPSPPSRATRAIAAIATGTTAATLPTIPRATAAKATRRGSTTTTAVMSEGARAIAS